MTAFDERKPVLMSYCRLDELSSEDEELLEGLYEDAVSYMDGAGVTEPEDGPRLRQYNTCINALVLDAWDHRGTQTGDKALVDNPAFRRRINQLKMTEPPASESDGGAAWS